jgi:hypothetical protein
METNTIRATPQPNAAPLLVGGQAAAENRGTPSPPEFCMKKSLIAAASAVLCCTLAQAQAPEMTLRDLEGKSPRKLNKDELTQLMTGAKMARISARGNQHYWTNDSGGSFVASSDNTGAGAVVRGQGKPSTARGKWHVSDDGRYCILIEWTGVPTEEWCRFVLDTSDGHYMVKSESVGTERVYKFDIKK